MKLDFQKALETRTGDVIRDNSFERSMVNLAVKNANGKIIKLMSDVANILDEAKVTFSTVLEEQGEPYTYSALFVGLLDGPRVKGDEELKAKDILIRRKLADRIFGAKEPISLTLKEEIPLLEKLAEKAYNDGNMTSLIVGQALSFLEEKEIGELDKKSDKGE